MFDVYLRQAGLIPEKAKNLLTPTKIPQSLSATTAAAEQEQRQLKRKPTVEPLFIVSLTSYHSRFASLLQTLKSLDQQEADAAYEIHVHLSNQDLDIRPEFRDNFAAIEDRCERIRFFYHAENLLSYKKLFYALTSYPHLAIITADDDVLYPRHWLAGLIKKHHEQPKCIICYRGHYLETNGKDFKKYTKIMFRRTACSGPSHWLLPTGVSGVLYPPGALDASIALDRESFMSLAPKADDLWFKLASLAKGTKCIRVNTYNTSFASVPFTQLSALAWSNTALGANDKVLKILNQNYAEVFDVLYEPQAAAQSEQLYSK